MVTVQATPGMHLFPQNQPAVRWPHYCRPAKLNSHTIALFQHEACQFNFQLPNSFHCAPWAHFARCICQHHTACWLECRCIGPGQGIALQSLQASHDHRITKSHFQCQNIFLHIIMQTPQQEISLQNFRELLAGRHADTLKVSAGPCPNAATFAIVLSIPPQILPHPIQLICTCPFTQKADPVRAPLSLNLASVTSPRGHSVKAWR